MSSASKSAPVFSANGTHNRIRVVADTAAIRVIKRTGDLVPFNASKISHALSRCFTSINAIGDIKEITKAVVGAVRGHCYATQPEIHIEEIQRIVIAQLWAVGEYEAAEHYTNYREQRRQARKLRPISPETEALVAEDRHHFRTDLEYYQFISKFSRWRDEEQRRETWREAVDERIMPWLTELPGVVGRLTAADEAELREMLFTRQALPAMRVIQMAGPSLQRCNIGAYNCAYAPIKDIQCFAELLYVLMQGSGMGFSVEDQYISQLPVVAKQTGKPKIKLVVEDDTESWCDTLSAAITHWWNGEDVDVDVSKVRPAGSKLKTKGGTASGPQPLLDLLQFTRNIILKRQGKRLLDVDVHRICCFIGRIVQVGGVRRASLISLSDLDSEPMRRLKTGQFWADTTHWNDAKYLFMSNNSAVYEERPDILQFMEEWSALAASGTGERGIFNREAARLAVPSRRKQVDFGVNPCGEILLRPFGLCNLSIAVARYDDTVESLKRKVRAATIFGVIQSTATNFRYVRPEWQRNATEERLLGVDITGHADCPLLRFGAPGRAALLRELKAVVADTRREFCDRFGINQSAADTTVKPSGDSAVFLDCASGVSPRFAQYQIRRVTERKDSPVSRMLQDAGVPHAESPSSPDLLVFEFLKSAPEGCTLRQDMTAIQQLDNWLEWKKEWAEHSVSATIYVDPHEWLDVGAWVYRHFNEITGLSFLPRDNGLYRLAPNEELTRQQFEEKLAEFPTINWAKLTQYELVDQTEAARTLACTGDRCES